MDDLNRLLAAETLLDESGDRYFTDLARQIDADTDPVPRVVLTGDARDGRTISIYEGVCLGPSDDDPLRRGFIWFATVGTVRTLPTRRDSRGAILPSRIIGDHVAPSTQSAQDALERARLNLTYR